MKPENERNKKKESANEKSVIKAGTKVTRKNHFEMVLMLR